MRENFYHDGFAWICRQCKIGERADDNGKELGTFTEGEAESRIPYFATRAMAKWADPARRFLMCPECGITEDTEVH